MESADYWVTLSSDKGLCGAGFLLTRRWILTAAHCLRNKADEASTVQISRSDGSCTTGTVVQFCHERDAALIQVNGPLTWTVLPVSAGVGQKGDEWLAPYRPSRRRSRLQGTVLTSPTEIECFAGGRIEALELEVRQHLGNYNGYSGSPVEWDITGNSTHKERVVVGMLIEQEPHMVRPKEFTNVLYAITLRHAIEAFDVLTPVPWFVRRRKAGASETSRAAPQTTVSGTSASHAQQQFTTARAVIAQIHSLVSDGLLAASDAAEEIRRTVRDASQQTMRRDSDGFSAD